MSRCRQKLGNKAYYTKNNILDLNVENRIIRDTFTKNDIMMRHNLVGIYDTKYHVENLCIWRAIIISKCLEYSMRKKRFYGAT